MGKLAKPQKSKKHKKIKFVDPFYDGERKERMHAGRNLAPLSTEQGISRGVKDLIRRTKQAKELNNKSRRQKKEIIRKRMLAVISTAGAKKEIEEVPEFKQKEGERKADFMRRVEEMTRMAIRESQIEASIKDKHDPVTAADDPPASKKKQRQKIKKLLKKEQQREKIEDKKDDFAQFKDEVKFGEVVHGLPSLSVRPRHATPQDKPAVNSLLLYKTLKQNSSQESSKGQTLPKLSREPGKGIKRKLLSPLQQKKMDRERQKAIDTYRQLKQNTS